MRRPRAHVIFGLLLAIPTALTVSAFAQEDPFAMPGETGAASDPFAAEAETGAEADSPFAPSFGEDTPSDPFAAPSSPESPGAPAAPEAPVASDPFASESSDSPFGAPTRSAESDPFGAPATATTEDDPFGAANEPSPFGSPSAQPPTGGANSQRITTLYEFRYMRQKTQDGREIVIRKMMTMDEAEEWDRQVKEYFREIVDAGEAPNFRPEANKADDWVDWMLYADQLELWTEYVENVVLVGTDPEASWDGIMWPGGGLNNDPEEDEEETGGDGRPRNIYNENRSLDDQLGDFAPVPDTRQNSSSVGVIDPQQMQSRAIVAYQNFLDNLRTYEEEQVAFMRDLKNGLDKRERRREAYRDWMDTQKSIILDYVSEWIRRFEGKVIMIAGVRYELYRPGMVPKDTVRGANIVETDFDITPYDLLNEDGTLRGPTE